MTELGGPVLAAGGDPDWYRKAVFYEVAVRGFYDSNDDGSGDLAGLTAKLDYLHWLGVDCLWLLPFYKSPLRDGGYDIADFFTVLPAYGDLADAVESGLQLEQLLGDIGPAVEAVSLAKRTPSR